MVDVVGQTHAVGQVQQVADGGHDIVNQDVLGHQRGEILVQQADLRQLVHALLLGGLQELLEGRQVNHLVDAGLFDFFLAQPGSRVHKVVADDANHAILQTEVDVVHARVLNLLGQRVGLGGRNALARRNQHLARGRVDDVLIDDVAANARGDRQLLVILVAAHAHHIIALGIKEGRVQQLLGGIDRADFARTQAAIDIHQAAFLALDLVSATGAARAVVAAVALHGGFELLIVAQQLADLLVAAIAQRAQQAGHRQLAGAVNTHPDHVVGVDFVLQPRAAARDHLRIKQVLAGLVDAFAVIYAGAAHELADDDALAAVDDERAVFGHQREIAHEYFGFLHFARLVIGQADEHLERRCVGHIALATFFQRILRRFIQRIIDELQLQIAVKIINRRNIVENLAQILLQETLVRILLNLDQVGHLHHFVNGGKALANPALTHIDVVNPDVLHDLSFLALVADGNHECHHP